MAETARSPRVEKDGGGKAPESPGQRSVGGPERLRAKGKVKVAADKTKVVIIGAGMAGVAAAQCLVAEGAGRFDITILEARDRVGGRIWSRHETLINGQEVGPVDMGAMFIHGIQRNPITRLSKQHSIPRARFPCDSIIRVRSNGKRYSDEQFSRTLEEFSDLERKAEERAQLLEVDKTMEDLFMEVGGRAVYDSPHIQWFLSVLLEMDLGTSLANLSACYATDDREYQGDDELFPDGLEELTRRMLSTVQAAVSLKLGQVVESVSVINEDTVKVTTTKGKVYTANNVLVTVPLGVLKDERPTFLPPLSDEKLGAIERLGFGNLVKVVLWFNEVWWPKANCYWGIDDQVEGTRGCFPVWINLAKANHSALMTAAIGDYADEVDEMSMKEVEEKAMAVLRRIQGTAMGNHTPIRVWKSRWQADEFSCGAFSYAAFDETAASSPANDFDTMAEPEGPILFAGEATCREFRGTIHGAYVSGRREARRMMGTLETRHAEEMKELCPHKGQTSFFTACFGCVTGVAKQ